MNRLNSSAQPLSFSLIKFMENSYILTARGREAKKREQRKSSSTKTFAVLVWQSVEWTFFAKIEAAWRHHTGWSEKFRSLLFVCGRVGGWVREFSSYSTFPITFRRLCCRLLSSLNSLSQPLQQGREPSTLPINPLHYHFHLHIV